MKIAVAALDQTHVSPHFGRSPHFMVYEVQDGKVLSHEARPNGFTPHAQGQCSGEHHGTEHAHHGHASVIEALKDCQAVLCFGMGWRAAADLKAAGIQVGLLESDCTPEEAAALYAQGRVSTSQEGFCRCHQ
jgi:predicted Fe-Mo cluster-binding NifX family protein